MEGDCKKGGMSLKVRAIIHTKVRGETRYLLGRVSSNSQKENKKFSFLGGSIEEKDITSDDSETGMNALQREVYEESCGLLDLSEIKEESNIIYLGLHEMTKNRLYSVYVPWTILSRVISSFEERRQLFLAEEKADFLEIDQLIVIPDEDVSEMCEAHYSKVKLRFEGDEYSLTKSSSFIITSNLMKKCLSFDRRGGNTYFFSDRKRGERNREIGLFLERRMTKKGLGP